MIRSITINDFIGLKENIPLIDVRTPAEFLQGHIPGAFSVPLFNDEERVKVGTTYKQLGREQAILLGFDLTGSKWSGFIKQALQIAPDKKISVHCWRGGMRSGAMAWALDLYGFEVYLIQGGYKKYRNWVHLQFENNYMLTIVGGMTGSGKTKLLHELRLGGQQVIDLEDLAQHQGSTYGTMNKMVQPTQEQFENNLANDLKSMNSEQRIWAEDESLTIGKRSIPNAFWHQMRNAVMIDIQVDLEHRVATLTKEYGGLDKTFLIECTERIRKRLGPAQTKNAINAIREGPMEEFIRLALVYYDKTYRTGLLKRDVDKVYTLTIDPEDLPASTASILNFVSNIQSAKHNGHYTG
ncbi:tRNA 2-selenouridine(34) synthase MnmH [Mucilaginibacter gilvus]|uniref:tRNA 2-selenouridine(34) synthase MnmH n=1 Tax=Mucilaginibacter gilvus TaxID=2305909 RepID=A0A3S3UKJ7_9SPHI|nr:tRNA 2-selenouridine(34) synthase MnmH [Mucilaginibacter gilvus]RWY48561.1 tRNA 2-selenouridine(34) synthase MnmH [Mucilaginibacter gilvus]